MKVGTIPRQNVLELTRLPDCSKIPKPFFFLVGNILLAPAPFFHFFCDRHLKDWQGEEKKKKKMYLFLASRRGL